MSATALKMATINRNGDADQGKLRLDLILDSDGRYRWHDEDGGDTEVSGDSIDDAITQACSAWSIGGDWDFELQD